MGVSMVRRKIGPLPADLPPDAEIEELAGLGTENITERDLTWLGDDLTLDPEPFLKSLETEDALREIVRCIVASHPGQIRPPPKGRSAEEDRVEIALDALLGRRPDRGRPPKDTYDVLIAVAKEYFTAFFNFDKQDLTLDTIIWSKLEQMGLTKSLSDREDARKDAIKAIRKVFNANKDRLIIRITSDGQEALQKRDADIEEVLAQLRKLGVINTPPDDGVK